MFFTTSGTHIFAYGSLILFQLPLHLLVLILKGLNTGSSLLKLTVCGLTLHYWLFIEIHLSGVTANKKKKKKNFVKNTFLINSNIFISYCSFSLTTYECLKHHQLLEHQKLGHSRSYN